MNTIINEHEILVNAVELASELAAIELEKTYTDRIVIFEEDDDETRYTEEAQDIFNDLYDKYWDIIEQTKVN